MRVAKLSAAVLIVGTMLLVGASARAAPVTVNFGSTGDNFMYSGTAAHRNNNWGTWEHIVAGPNTTTNGPPYRGLLHTDDREETITVTDGLGTQNSTENRGFRWGADTLEDAGLVFTDLKTDGFGNLVLTVTGPVGNNPFLNAVVLRAVPEPGAGLMLLLAGLAGLWFRRRAR